MCAAFVSSAAAPVPARVEEEPENDVGVEQGESENEAASDPPEDE